MKKGQSLWTREEIILAINLYNKLPFGRLNQRTMEVVELSKLIKRTPGAVAYKLVNLASLDPSLKKRGIKGASNASKLDNILWDEFYNNLEDLAYYSEILRAKLEGISIEESFEQEGIVIKSGLDRETTIKQRINQSFFRKMILASYNETCLITGLKHKDLLIAGHIRPWAEDKENRLNPRNGIAINSLHDIAFEKGLISISPDYKIHISTELLNSKSPEIENYFIKYHNQNIILPTKFLPSEDFLEYHFNTKFRR